MEKFCGRIIATINVYVGEQLEKIGPRDNQIRIFQNIHSLFLFWRKFNLSSFNIDTILYQRFLFKIIIQYKTIIIQANIDKNLVFIQINKVVILRSRVKIKTEKAKDEIITIILLSFHSTKLVHKMIGNTGSTQGVITVTIQAKNDINISVNIIQKINFKIFYYIIAKNIPT